MALTVVDLANGVPNDAVLLCKNCENMYSANAADYWDRGHDDVFYCADPECDGNSELVLVVPTHGYTIVKE